MRRNNASTVLAITVAMAAPSTPSSGKGPTPNIKKKLSTVFTAIDTADTTVVNLTLSVLMREPEKAKVIEVNR